MWRCLVRTLEREVDAESAFRSCFAGAPAAFWLDSSLVEPGRSRFSYLGDARGPHAELISHRVGERPSVFDLLARRVEERRVEGGELPFDLVGGYVGYFGYELRAECGSPVTRRAATPDAQWIFADRLLVVDHAERRTHLVAVHPAQEGDRAARGWLDLMARRLDGLPAAPEPGGGVTDPRGLAARGLARGTRRYLEDIGTCLDHLRAGESYELCLTDTVLLPPVADPLGYYARLRRLSPAPHAALLRFPGLDVACASPERFLRVDRERWAEARPIKGTAPRDADPEIDEKLRAGLVEDPKTRAENLMIVDLMRNDLGRVCEPGTVGVRDFLATESYATVHQLASTVRGRLRDGVRPLDCVRACFPGGSMTGAPKLRSMELLDAIEGRPRGVYSGALGYLSLNGTVDLNIVIRTAVLTPDQTTVGAGGAIVLDSRPAEELEEMLLKAAVPVRALSPA